MYQHILYTIVCVRFTSSPLRDLTARQSKFALIAHQIVNHKRQLFFIIFAVKYILEQVKSVAIGFAGLGYVI